MLQLILTAQMETQSMTFVSSCFCSIDDEALLKTCLRSKKVIGECRYVTEELFSIETLSCSGMSAFVM